jgi:type VI secretion system secreted protein Hcp
MAFTCYVSFKGAKQGQLKPESKKSKRTDKWSEGLFFETSSEVPFDPKSGRPKGSRTHHPLTITKEIGASSPQLLSAHWSNELFPEVVIEIVGRPDTGAGEVVTERITLTDALIVKVRRYTPTITTEHTQHDTDQLEEISFTFRMIQVENLAASTSVSDDVNANNQG